MTKQPTKTLDELIAGMPSFIQTNYKKFMEPKDPEAEPLPQATNSCALANFDADDEPRPTAQPVPLFTGKITPSIYASKGNLLSLWNANGVVDVVLRDGNGYQHYGRLAPSLLAEGGFGQPASEEDRAFLRQIYDDVVGPERSIWFDEEGRRKADHGDFNYSHRATCLWTNRDRSGTPHPRAFLAVTWKSNGRSSFPVDALLFDGGEHRLFELHREQAGGDRPQWKGYAR